MRSSATRALLLNNGSDGRVNMLIRSTDPFQSPETELGNTLHCNNIVQRETLQSDSRTHDGFDEFYDISPTNSIEEAAKNGSDMSSKDATTVGSTQEAVSEIVQNHSTCLSAAAGDVVAQPTSESFLPVL